MELVTRVAQLSISKCQALTLKNKPCKMNALNSGFCSRHQHRPVVDLDLKDRCIAIKKDEQRCPYPAHSSTHPYCRIHGHKTSNSTRPDKCDSDSNEDDSENDSDWNQDDSEYDLNSNQGDCENASQIESGSSTSLVEPLTQGTLDGLCGMYASVNAFHALQPLKQQDQDELTQQLMKITTIKEVPDGTNIDKVVQYVKAICVFMNTKYPKILFSVHPHVSFKLAFQVFQFLDKIDYETSTVLIGLFGAAQHWTVIHGRYQDAYCIFDSNAKEPRWELSKKGIDFKDPKAYRIHWAIKISRTQREDE